jgi:hypothetical protein
VERTDDLPARVRLEVLEDLLPGSRQHPHPKASFSERENTSNVEKATQSSRRAKEGGDQINFDAPSG